MIAVGQQVRDGYWTFMRAVLIPGFLTSILGKTLIRRLSDRDRGWGDKNGTLTREVLVAALELEHRRRSIKNRSKLLIALKQVRSADYDLVPAIALARAVKEARSKQDREIGAQREGERERKESLRLRPASIELVMELSDKNLPMGASANLALMRALVNLPPKRES